MPGCQGAQEVKGAHDPEIQCNQAASDPRHAGSRSKARRSPDGKELPRQRCQSALRHSHLRATANSITGCLGRSPQHVPSRAESSRRAGTAFLAAPVHRDSAAPPHRTSPRRLPMSCVDNKMVVLSLRTFNSVKITSRTRWALMGSNPLEWLIEDQQLRCMCKTDKMN